MNDDRLDSHFLQFVNAVPAAPADEWSQLRRRIHFEKNRKLWLNRLSPLIPLMAVGFAGWLNAGQASWWVGEEARRSMGPITREVLSEPTTWTGSAIERELLRD